MDTNKTKKGSQMNRSNIIAIFLFVNLYSLCNVAHGFATHYGIHKLSSIISTNNNRVPSRSQSYNQYRTKQNDNMLLYSSTKDKLETDNNNTKPSSSTSIASAPTRYLKRHIPKRAMDIYIKYLTRLWSETNITSRQKIANQKAYYAIKHVQHMLKDGEEYVDIMNGREGDSLDDIEKKIQARDDLLQACTVMLDLLGPGEGDSSDSDMLVVSDDKNSVTFDHKEIQSSDLNMNEKSDLSESGNESQIAVSNNDAATQGQATIKKTSRSVLFGATMGAIVACWVFSGNHLFTALFTLMTILGQLEYYRMVMRVGIYPARKISVVGACAMFVTVCL